ncbi:MAG: ATP-binding protein [Kofleriaceae bacterium]
MGTVPIPVVQHDPATPTPGESLVGHPAPGTSDLPRRVARLLLLRTLVVSVVLTLSMWLSATAGQAARPAMWLQSGIIAATYLSSILFGVFLRIGVKPRKVAQPMWAVDIIVTSLFVYVTGGVQSPYIFLYALSIVSAGALSYRRGAIVVTVSSIGAITTVSLLAWTRAFDLPRAGSFIPWEQSGPDLVRMLGIQLVVLTGVGALAFIFGDQLQRGAETLATTRKAAADLFTLHQNIVRSLGSGLITIAPDGTVLTANQAASDILRRQGVDITNRSIEVSMPGLLGMLAESKGELRRADLTLGELVVGVTVSPLRDLDDQVIGRIVNFQDLTELRRLELTTRRAERLATVGELAAGVAHEIRNPLASISGSIELLRSVPQASEDDRALMNIVHREVQRLNVLIGDLLDYANPRPNQPVDFDLGVLVRETLQVARGDQSFAEIEVTCDVEEELPITADPAKLRQVLWNLLRNAADAAASGGKHVTVAAAATATATTITVTDDGPGIPRDKLARIFDPFFTTKKRGTGLGLAQCHAIVAEHGGRIDVDSDAGKGAKMVVILPRTAIPSMS